MPINGLRGGNRSAGKVMAMRPMGDFGMGSKYNEQKTNYPAHYPFPLSQAIQAGAWESDAILFIREGNLKT